MQLNEQQKDALTELINIGFGRAASALSILVEQRVLIEAPAVDLFSLSDLQQAIQSLSNGEITSVHQVFSGRLSGTAMLLIDSPGSSALIDLLNGGEGVSRAMTEADREAMQEVGNILLNAFTGSFGNLLQVHISFSVPHVHYQSLETMLHSVLINQKELEYALVVHVNFRVLKGNVSGYVIIILGLQSLEALLESMRTFGYID
jgi:chemotaxis protein CheC